MKAKLHILMVPMIVMLSLHFSCDAQGCDKENDRYQNLTNPLVGSYQGLERASTREERDRVTNEAREMLQSDVLILLQDAQHPVTSTALAAYVACIQNGKPYANLSDIVKVPAAFPLSKSGGGEALAYVIYRGPINAAIPDTTAFIDFFPSGSSGGQVVSYPVPSFEASTIEVHKVDSGLPREDWFLLSGFSIGDTGTRLKLSIIGFDGHKARTVWEKSGLERTTLESVDGKVVVLSKYEGFAADHDVYKKIQWAVNSEGLLEVNDPSTPEQR